MQNPSINKPSKQLHDISESAKEAVDHAIPELRNKVKGIASDTAEQISEVKHQAKGWLQEHPGKLLGFIGVIAAIGTVGYLLGRNNSTSDLWSSSRLDS